MLTIYYKAIFRIALTFHRVIYIVYSTHGNSGVQAFHTLPPEHAVIMVLTL